MRFIAVLLAAVVIALAGHGVVAEDAVAAPAPAGAEVDGDKEFPKVNVDARVGIRLNSAAGLNALRGLAMRRKHRGKDTTQLDADIATIERDLASEIAATRAETAARRSAMSVQQAESKRYPVNLTPDQKQTPNPAFKAQKLVDYNTCCKWGPPLYGDHPGLYEDPAMHLFPYCQLEPITLGFMWLMGYPQLDTGLWCAPECDYPDLNIESPPTSGCPQVTTPDAAPAWCAFEHPNTNAPSTWYCGIVCQEASDCGSPVEQILTNPDDIFNDPIYIDGPGVHGDCRLLPVDAYSPVISVVGVCSHTWDENNVPNP